MSHPRRHLLIGFTALALGAAALSGGAAQADTSPYTTVITGLNNPRDVAFDAAGNLYVSQAGKYLGTASQPAGTSMTGAVSKYTPNGPPDRAPLWSTPLTSMYDLNPLGQPEVLGPGGLSAVGNGCGQATHSAHGWSTVPGKSCNVLVIMNESQAGTGISHLGLLYRLQGATGSVLHEVSDVGDQMHAWTTANSDLVPGQFPDSNPYAVLTTRDQGRVRTFVADAGANTISEIMPNGTAHVIAFLPNSAISDAIPTCITQGPDGYLYVGTLHLFEAFAIGPGTAQVYKVDPNYTGSDPTQNETQWASGLTTVTGCTFDQQGNFWASEMFYGLGVTGYGPPGDLAEIKAGDASSTTFGDPSTGVTHYAGFPLPGGMAVGPGGGLYTTIWANGAPATGMGEVVKVNP